MFSAAVILCQICGAKISRKSQKLLREEGYSKSVVRGGPVPTYNPYLLICQFR